MQKNQFLKVINNLLEFEKDFIELKDIELKGIEVKITRVIKELIFKLIIITTDDMDSFEKQTKKEMKKINTIKKSWYDWLISYIPITIRKNVGGFKDKIVSLFKTNTSPKKIVYGRGNKLGKPIKQNIQKAYYIRREQGKLKDGIFRDI